MQPDATGSTSMSPFPEHTRNEKPSPGAGIPATYGQSTVSLTSTFFT
jgi:hypothetical protein